MCTQICTARPPSSKLPRLQSWWAFINCSLNWYQKVTIRVWKEKEALMKHKAAIQLPITMFSCLNSHRACVYQEKTHARGGGQDEERGQRLWQSPGVEESDLVLATWPSCPLLPLCPETGWVTQSFFQWPSLHFSQSQFPEILVLFYVISDGTKSRTSCFICGIILLFAAIITQLMKLL